MTEANTPRTPDAEAVRAQAASWLLRRRDYDGWTDEDQRSLDVWLDDSLAHRIAYLRLEAVWRDADRLTVLRPRSERQMVTALRGFAPRLARMAALTAIVGALGAGALFYFSPTTDRTYATSIGERKIVTLADGSHIELNTDTSLRVSTGSDGRHVALLKGEAFFQITHNAKTPFVVEAGNYRVIDLGTQFAIRRDYGKLDVDLVEGSARFESSNTDGSKQQSLVLTPGDTVVATADSLSVSKKPADAIADALGWRRGVLVFHRTKLADVVAEYNRYNVQKLGIADPALAQRTITATLPSNDVEAFARIANDFFGLHIARRGNDFVISR
jgi:transmembrane sensor